MRHQSWLAVLYVVCALLLSAPARAQAPQLWVYLSASASDVAPASDLILTLSGYSAFAVATPVTVTVNLPDALTAQAVMVLSTHAGIACTATAHQAVCALTIEDQKPLTMAVRVRAQLTADILSRVRATIAGGGTSADGETSVRVEQRRFFLPLLIRG